MKALNLWGYLIRRTPIGFGVENSNSNSNSSPLFDD